MRGKVFFYSLFFWVSFLPTITPLPYCTENSLGSLPFPLPFTLQSTVRILNTFSFLNDKKNQNGGQARSSGIWERLSLFTVFLCTVPRPSEGQLYPFTSCLLWMHGMLPLNFTIFTCKMGLLPRTVGRFHEMIHKMLSM